MEDLTKESNIPISEVSIKVPWGHIAGKVWGHSNGQPVLALHGWLDNAGSFDKLIPLLSHDLYIVAIDWPGHGLSSPRPAGAYYHLINMVADLKYVVDGLGWSRFSILAHSMGVGPAITFAASLPELVDRMVLLEGLTPVQIKAKDFPTQMGITCTVLTAPSMQNKPEMVYPSLEACVSRIMQANSELTKEAATALVQRGTTQVDNGYIFTRDRRVKLTSLLHTTEEISTSYLESIKCPTLVIMAEISVFSHEKIKKLVQVLKEAKMIIVSGNHHVHLNNAPVVAPAVNEHLLKDFPGAHKSQL